MIAFGVLYVLIGLVTAVCMARWYVRHPSEWDEGPGEQGFAAILAGILWPLMVLIFGGAWIARNFQRVATLGMK